MLLEEPSLINLMVSVDVKHHERKIKIVLIADVFLISLMISVDVKHHDCLLTYLQEAKFGVQNASLDILWELFAQFGKPCL